MIRTTLAVIGMLCLLGGLVAALFRDGALLWMVYGAVTAVWFFAAATVMHILETICSNTKRAADALERAFPLPPPSQKADAVDTATALAAMKAAQPDAGNR